MVYEVVIYISSGFVLNYSFSSSEGSNEEHILELPVRKYILEIYHSFSLQVFQIKKILEQYNIFFYIQAHFTLIQDIKIIFIHCHIVSVINLIFIINIP